MRGWPTGLVVLVLVVTGGVSAAGWAAPVSKEAFQAQTTGDLVALCGASSADPLYTPAQNFCHGFVVATYRMLHTEQMATRSKRKMFCMQANPPNRDQAIAAFVKWASERPKTLASPPSDGILEYLVNTYPCS